MKAKHAGDKRPFLESVSGSELHRDTGEWRDVQRVVDREGDHYSERITDEAGNVVREADHRLRTIAATVRPSADRRPIRPHEMHQETTMPIRPMKAVPVGQAVEVESAMPLTILMRTHLWVSWTRIAIDQEAMAKAARQELVQAAPEDRDGFMLQREADAALVAICAAAFALEAFTRELDDLITLPPTTQAAWQRRPPSADRQVLELLKLAVDPRGLIAAWTRELAWLFGVRGGAVHYEGVNEPSRPHPVGINVSVAQVTYSPENATRAVDLLLGILERCRDRPKPPVQGWSRSIRHAFDELISRRSQAE